MNLVVPAIVTVTATAVAIGAMLLMRRRAPDGGYFADGDRASGIFGMLATGFSVLLGFIVFLAFTSYDRTRTGAENEAVVLFEQFQTAQLLPEAHRSELTGELVCYGRSVVFQEWPMLESGSRRTDINPWGVALFRTLEQVQPTTPVEQAAYDKWLDQTFTRNEVRNDRLHGAEGVIPLPVWLVLLFTSGVIFTFMLFFADSGERAISQGVLIGSVVAVMVSSLFLLRFLDDPYRPGVGGLHPVNMERSLETIQEARTDLGLHDPLPCDAAGAPA
jgi:hypothetical protein